MNKRKTESIITVLSAAVLVATLSFFCLFSEKNDYSYSERRSLAGLPEISAQSIASGEFTSDFETYSQDQFPLRESFRRLKALFSGKVLMLRDNNGIFTSNGQLSKLDYKLNTEMLDHAGERFNYIYEKYLENTDCRLYFSIVPDKNKHLTADGAYPSLDYDALTDYMLEKTSYMSYIEIGDLICADDYYSTDTHWRQENIIPVADRLLSAMGAESIRASYTENTLDAPFYGVYSGQSALNVSPDTIVYLTGGAIDDSVVTLYGTGSPVPGEMYDMKKAGGHDAYEMFLSGSEPLITIENPDSSSTRELVVFRDSFGSSIAPLLTDSYAKITLVDIRYMHPDVLESFVGFNTQDVLFLYSTVLLNNSLAIK